MGHVKTAISVPKSLFDEAEEWARRMKVSRSGLFALALDDYIRRQKNCELLSQINAASADGPDTAERALRRKSRRLHRRTVEGQW